MNGTPPRPRLWRITIEAPAALPAALAGPFEELILCHAETVVRSGIEASAATITGFSAAKPDGAAVGVGLALLATAFGVPVPQLRIEDFPDRDWVGENRERFAPLAIGRFLIVGEDDRAMPAPPGRCKLWVDAGPAFGSGRHPSTAACLVLLEKLQRSHAVGRALDVGCGSGILAVAAARLWPGAAVAAADVDGRAVAVTKETIRRNGVGGRIAAVTANGTNHRRIAAAAPCQLVIANILARPLRRMAGALAGVLSPGGVCILAGFVDSDWRAVAAPYRSRGFRLLRRISLDGWSSLALTKPISAPGPGWGGARDRR